MLCLKLAAFSISLELISPSPAPHANAVLLLVVLPRAEKAWVKIAVNPLHRYAGVDAVMYVCQYYPQGNVALPEYFTANVMPLI